MGVAAAAVLVWEGLEADSFQATRTFGEAMPLLFPIVDVEPPAAIGVVGSDCDASTSRGDERGDASGGRTAELGRGVTSETADRLLARMRGGIGLPSMSSSLAFGAD